MHDTREELCEVGKILRAEGHVEYVLGTISERKTAAHTFITKPQDVDYLSMTPDDLVCVNINGFPLEPKTAPSLNWLTHKACYEAGSEIGGVVHAHPQCFIALTSQANERFSEINKMLGVTPPYITQLLATIPLLTEEACWALNPSKSVGQYIPVVEDLSPQGLGEYARNLIPSYNAFAIRNHGIITVGRNATEALGIALVLIKEVASILDIYKAGGKPLFRQEESIRQSIKNMPLHFRWRKYNQAISL